MTSLWNSSKQQQLARNTPIFLESLCGRKHGMVTLFSLKMRADLGHRGCRAHLGFLPWHREFSQSSARSSGDLHCYRDNCMENVRAGSAGHVSGFGEENPDPLSALRMKKSRLKSNRSSTVLPNIQQQFITGLEFIRSK